MIRVCKNHNNIFIPMELSPPLYLQHSQVRKATCPDHSSKTFIFCSLFQYFFAPFLENYLKSLFSYVIM